MGLLAYSNFAPLGMTGAMEIVSRVQDRRDLGPAEGTLHNPPSLELSSRPAGQVEISFQCGRSDQFDHVTLKAASPVLGTLA
jgi:hypothetical protein